MPTLASMIEALQPVASGGAVLSVEDARDILRTLEWVQKHEADIRIIAKAKQQVGPDFKLVDPDQEPTE